MTLRELMDSLVARRKKLGLTQGELAKLIGRNPSTVSHFENFYRLDPTFTTLERYAAAVGYTITLKETTSGNEVLVRDPDSSREGAEGEPGL